ncbi:hypothetical protein [Parahaliea mediterranea]|uniref:hypothetical protein n=1 Tax=Parahaliea mediterranea TaxID=651086 RepID=UPI0013006FB7|nr:hypothetical protein [Parahaliea mediterranea]
MDKDLDSQQDTGASPGAAPASAAQGQSRRRFTRSAAIGGAVVLTLGNRVAWGGGDRHGDGGKKVCVSQHVWDSYVNGDGSASSAPTDEQRREVEKFKKYLEKSDRPYELDASKGEYCVRKSKSRDHDDDHKQGGGNHFSLGSGRDYKQEFMNWGYESGKGGKNDDHGKPW